MGQFPPLGGGGGGYPGSYPIVNADIAAAAAIAKSKLAALAIVNGDIDPAAAIAKSKLAALGIVDADVAAGAAIARSKLGALAIVNADIDPAAAIAKSKLAALGIVDADVAAGAAIARSKLAAELISGQAENSLRIIRGSVTAAGAVQAGGGFSVVRNSAGDYTVTFTTALATVPNVQLTAGETAGNLLAKLSSTTAPSVNGFRVVTLTANTGASTDSIFDFVAIGT